MQKFISCLVAATCLGASSLVQASQDGVADYPNKPLRLVVPFTAGGTPDLLARIVGAELNSKWGKPIVVENMPGAAGNIATSYVARAEPDGYTCLMGSSSGLTINPHLYKNLQYNVAKDLAPVTQVATTPLMLVASKHFEPQSLDAVIAEAKSNPGAINYASAGMGTPHHLSMVLLAQSTGLDVNHVPYKGTAPAMIDLVSGRVSVMFETIQGAIQQVQEGKLKALAVSGEKRLIRMPNIPTVSETVPGFNVNAWYGIVCPAKVPRPIIQKLYGAVSEILKMDKVAAQLERQELVAVGNTPEAFAKVIREQSAGWGEVIGKASIPIN